VTAKSTVSCSSIEQTHAKAQYLPISAYIPIGKNTTICLEVAKTHDQQELGLMYRPPLPPDRGMLFPFNPAQPVTFWMKNTPEPLDMVFLLNGVIKYIQVNAIPCQLENCPTYGPVNTNIDNVIELRSGRSAELGLKVGDKLDIQFQNK
jgi:uncharacterized membrane protein (UPF0127 family)